VKTLAPVVVTVRPRAAGTGAGDRPAAPVPPPQASGPAAHLSLSAKERFLLLEQFATLVDSGIQIAPALQGMQQQSVDARKAAVLRALEQGVVAGLPLSAAMAAMPRAFPPLLVQLVRAGEATGQLGEMLRRTVDTLELEATLRGKARSAMLYPAIMAMLTAGVVVFLLTFIVPKFEKLLRGKQLPRPTRMLLAAGDFVTANAWLLAGGIAAAVVGLAWFVRTARGRVWLDRLLLSLPGIGPLYRTAVLARCSRTFGLLLHAGVPVHGALEYTQEVAGSASFHALWQRARERVVGGATLLDALRGQPLLGPSFEQLIAAGEQTATLDRVMQKHADHQTKDLERRIRDLLTIVEPLMVLVMAVVVGFVALSIMLPIFQMSRT
jgi:type IV pilus assembly protein PilC